MCVYVFEIYHSIYIIYMGIDMFFYFVTIVKIELI